MSDLNAMLKAIDELPQDELDVLYRYVVQHRRADWWLIPSENISRLEQVLRPVYDQTAQMTESEINATIDEAIAEVRRERQVNRGL